jgi:hypothetical protein
MKRIALIVASILANLSAHARCSNESYTISGLVTEASSSSPVVGAEVAITWTDFSQSHKVTAQTDSMGRYSISLAFRPWSGNVNGHDECRAKLTQTSVIVSALGFERQSGAQPVPSVATTANYSLKRTAAGRLR